uniref:Mdh6 n=1 Tax=Arundo donax TaxID=35708 RepID=A0A0A9DIR7_ARUDO
MKIEPSARCPMLNISLFLLLLFYFVLNRSNHTISFCS